MHRISFIRRRMIAGLAVVLGGLLGGTAIAQPPMPPAVDVKIDAATGALIVPLSGAVQFDPKTGKNVSDTFVRNDNVLQVRPNPGDAKTLILVGRQAGATQITLTFADMTKGIYDVVVQPDYDLLRSVIRRTVPTASVEVIPGVGNVIILTGYVTRPEDSDTIQRIASSAVGGDATNVINSLQIGGAQHVLIDVTFAQVDRTEIRSRGFDFVVGGTDATFSSIVSGLISVTGGGLGVAGPQFSTNANLQLGILPPQIFGALRALRSEGIAKFLSEPKVITQSGRPASFRAGGQQAVLGQAAGITGPGAQLEEVGTTLEVLPLVLGNGKIYLEVNPSFRSVNNGRGVTIGGSFTPGFNEQSTRSSILLESGQTYAIGGLLESEHQGSTQKVPFLGDLPWVGTMFSSVSYTERETELVILVTPRLVDALDCNQVPLRVPGKETRKPDDYELFLEGILEAPRGQRKVWNGHCYVPAYRCSATAQHYPCVGNLCVGGIGGTGCSVQGCNGVGCATLPATTAAGTYSPAPSPQTIIPTYGTEENIFPTVPTGEPDLIPANVP
jgi:pilus assembly protein CpaC